MELLIFLKRVQTTILVINVSLFRKGMTAGLIIIQMESREKNVGRNSPGATKNHRILSTKTGKFFLELFACAQMRWTNKTL